MASILVVEDNPGVRGPMVRLLRRHGYEVMTAANAYEAMGSIKRSVPDLILLDVMIPPMDGLTLLSLLRDDPAVPDIPVIVISGLSDPQTLAREQDLGVRKHMLKASFSSQELLEAVRSIVES